MAAALLTTAQFAAVPEEHPDLIITMGGDGSILYVASLFQHIVPPVLCFNFGSLGFLATFAFDRHEEVLRRVIDGLCSVTVRMRLQCDIDDSAEHHHSQSYPAAYVDSQAVPSYHVLNEVVLDRGPSPYISNLQIFCDDELVTVVQGDGLIIATPTGSTAYSVRRALTLL